MENTSVGQDIKNIVEGIRNVVTKSLANNPFQPASTGIKPDLELAVMAALATGAKNGTAVVTQIRLSSAGTYSPSQAQVRVVLEALQEKRWAKIVVRDDLRLYELTKSGAAEFDSRQTAAPADEAVHQHQIGCSHCESKNWVPHAGVLSAGARLAQTVAEASAPSQSAKHQQVIELLEATRVKLQALLAEKH